MSTAQNLRAAAVSQARQSQDDLDSVIVMAHLLENESLQNCNFDDLSLFVLIVACSLDGG